MNREVSEVSLDGYETGQRLLERRTHAWIPTGRAEQVLSESLLPPDKRAVFTTPRLMQETSLGDPVSDLLVKNDVEACRANRTTGDSSIQELRRLIASGNFRAAIDVTGRLLSSGNDHAAAKAKHLPESFQIWGVRFQLLIALKMTALLLSELDHFGDLEGPDLYFQYHPEAFPARRGSMVPFSLRLVHAEAAKFSPTPEDALGRLQKLASIINTMLSNLSQGKTEDGISTVTWADREESERLWKDRLNAVHRSRANCFLLSQDYHLALTTLAKVSSKLEVGEERASVEELLGRVALQLGDQTLATDFFRQSQNDCHSSVPNKTALTFMNRGYIAMFHGSYDEAYEHFAQSYSLDPLNVNTANNAAVCLLYIGRLNDAIKLLEKALFTAHVSATTSNNLLSESTALNLVTLYELASASTSQRKTALLHMAAQCRGDAFSASAFKLL